MKPVKESVCKVETKEVKGCICRMKALDSTYKAEIMEPTFWMEHKTLICWAAMGNDDARERQ